MSDEDEDVVDSQLDEDSFSEGAEEATSVLTGDALAEYTRTIRGHLQEISNVLCNIEDDDEDNDETIHPVAVEAIPLTVSDTMLSRPRALEEFGVLNDFSRLGDACVLLAGLGRVGSRVAELLVRGGMKKLILVDKGYVNESHLQGSAYYPRHIGISKTQAMRLSLYELDPSVTLHTETLDILDESQNIRLRELVLNKNDRLPEKELEQVDLVISALDCEVARNEMNSVCLDSGIPLFDVFIRKSGIAAQSRFVLPGKTGCLECVSAAETRARRRTSGLARKEAAESFKSKSLTRHINTKYEHPGLSLLLAGVVSQNVFKFLLEYGKVNSALVFKYEGDKVTEQTLQAAPSLVTTARSSFMLSECAPSNEYRLVVTEPYAECTNMSCRVHQKRKDQGDELA